MLRRYLLPAIAIIATATACAKQDRSSSNPDSTAARAAGMAISIASRSEVTVTAKDFAFDAPSEIPAGVTTLHLVNQGKEIHHVQVLKFEQGKTLADFMTALKAGEPPPIWTIEIGGPNAPAPGGESSATLTLEVGSYAFVCFVDTPDHVPHVRKGMSHQFTVVPNTTAAVPEPTADVTVTLADYSFTLSQPLTAG